MLWSALIEFAVDVTSEVRLLLMKKAAYARQLFCTSGELDNVRTSF
jgi:hypothetical protein